MIKLIELDEKEKKKLKEKRSGKDFFNLILWFIFIVFILLILGNAPEKLELEYKAILEDIHSKMKTFEEGLENYFIGRNREY